MALDYETSIGILNKYPSFPSREDDQREIILMGTPRGVIYGRGRRGRPNYKNCSPQQAYRVAQRIHKDCEKIVKGKRISANKDLADKVGIDLIEDFLRETGTESPEDWGGVDEMMKYISP